MELVKEHKSKNCSEYYYATRNLDRDIERFNKLSNTERGAWFYYICTHSFYINKYNKKIQVVNGFSYSAKDKNFEKKLDSFHEYIYNSDITFINGDFKEVVKNITANDFVYFDPPYLDLDNRKISTDYNLSNSVDVINSQLKEELVRLDKLGVPFLLSNGYFKGAEEYYQPFNVEVFNHSWSRASIKKKETSTLSIQEILVKNY